jgi:nitrogen regulatory protein PII
MSLPLKRLTVLAPRDLEASLLAAVLDLQPAVPGFTTTHVSGHGERFEGTRVKEQVRGRVDRVMMWLVLPAEDVERVLTQLRRCIPNPDIVWWMEPVDAMGRLA